MVSRIRAYRIRLAERRAAKIAGKLKALHTFTQAGETIPMIVVNQVTDLSGQQAEILKHLEQLNNDQ